MNDRLEIALRIYEVMRGELTTDDALARAMGLGGGK